MVSSIDLKALNIFLSSPVSHDMIHKLVVSTLQVIPCKDTKATTLTPTKADTVTKQKQLPSLMTFLTRLVRYTNVYTGTLMATLAYLNKLKSRLPKNAQGLPCTRHRILLSCLILSAKYHNDSSPKNIHWAKYTDGLFTVEDINLMERQLLYLLNWDLKVTNEDMMDQLSGFLEPIKEDLFQSRRMRRFLKKQQQQQQQKFIQQTQYQQQLQNQQLQQQEPKMHSRNNSSTSIFSTNSTNSHISSSSSESSLSLRHFRQDSSSSISSLESITCAMTKPAVYPIDQIDPAIELAALKEEIELNKMIKQFKSNNTRAVSATSI